MPTCNGNIWVTSPDGALRFNIKEEKFTEFKSVTYKNEHGTATVYGLAADRTGNGWWLLMTQDLIDYSDITTGKTGEFKLPPEKAVMENLTPNSAKCTRRFSRRISTRHLPGRRRRAAWAPTRTATMFGSATRSAAHWPKSISRPRRRH